MRRITFSFLLFILLIILLLPGCHFQYSSSQELWKSKVIRVIDGDTIQIENGEKIRLLHINANERGEACYEEAKERLEELIFNRTVLLKEDKEDKDKYGRLLRFIYLNETNVNLLLVQEGLATAYIILPNTKYKEEFFEAEGKAVKERKGCLWKKDSKYEGCISIEKIAKCSEGDFIVLRNNCKDINLEGWLPRDQSRARAEFEGNFEANSTLKITREEWKSNHKCIWYDYSDAIFLFDDQGALVLYYRYKT